MSSIGSFNNPQITLNGSSMDAKIKVLDVSQREAKNLVDSRKDGYDTIGATIDGKDVILLAKHNKGILTTDQLQINGQRAEIKFVENEMNTKKEFIEQEGFMVIPMTAGSALFGTLLGAGAEAAIKGVGSAKGIAIGIGASLALCGSALYHDYKKAVTFTDESINKSITK